MQMTDNTILITGGTSGIGYELARQLCETNTVIITSRSQEKLDQAKSELKKVHTFKSDVANLQDVIDLYGEVSKKFPALNMLINNAGILKKIDLQKADDLNNLMQEIDTNLSGAIRMSVQFLPLLKKQSSAAIVNVTSALGFVPLASTPVYCATKAALHSFSESLRIQLKHTNVKVFEVAPPAIETPMINEFDAHEQKALSAMDVSKLVKISIREIRCNKQEIKPGLSKVIRTISRLSPNLALNMLNKPKKQG